MSTQRIDAAVARHCTALERCNQRGGRMLSVLDLLDAGTLDLDLAAYLMEQIMRGASFMVGAGPGGAGKTTVMCALLNFVPADVELVAATAQTVRNAARGGGAARRCFICHEIGSGPYFAYLWGRDLRDYCSLIGQGHILATNLHADDLDETRGQVCLENGVPEAHFNRFDLLIYLLVTGGFSRTQRRIEKVYASDSREPHALVYSARSGPSPDRHGPRQRQCRAFLEEELRSHRRTIEEVRRSTLTFLDAGR